MRNLHTLLGAQQGFRHELAANYAFLINCVILMWCH